jgi:hypothetical protein
VVVEGVSRVDVVGRMAIQEEGVAEDSIYFIFFVYLCINIFTEVYYAKNT